MILPSSHNPWPTPDRRLTPTPFPITPALIWLALAFISVGAALAAFTP